MENLEIAPTRRTPRISFDCGKNLLEIRGRSYPSNISECYGPVFSWLEEYLGKLDDTPCTVNIELVYFNSSSSKILLDLFLMLEEAVNKGSRIAVNWIYDEDDEDNMEYGEEFQEDLESLPFHLLKKES